MGRIVKLDDSCIIDIKSNTASGFSKEVINENDVIEHRGNSDKLKGYFIVKNIKQKNCGGLFVCDIAYVGSCSVKVDITYEEIMESVG